MPLYLVFTPIGNLEDISLRALRVLSEADVIAAEDTRHTGQLLAHYHISNPLISLHEHNEASRIQNILNRLAQGELVAVVSDAGAPIISDPGYQLVRAAIAAGYRPIPIPGPTAFVAALTASGLPGHRFLFLGFPPRKTKARAELLKSLRSEPGSLIFYESPRRLPELLAAIAQELGADRTVVVARELTKLHEDFWQGTAAEAMTAFSRPPRGEIVVLVEGAQADAGDKEIPPEVDELLSGLEMGGVSVGDAARLLAQVTGLPRRVLYQRALALKQVRT
jgi:16S rRNA (cytidine1402-2'-O)-methyltransferase